MTDGTHEQEKHETVSTPVDLIMACNGVAPEKNETDGAASRAEGANLTAGLGGLLAAKHTGMKISARGVLGRIADGRYYKELNFGCGEMLRHLEEMAERFYSGDPKAVDEFLQLYDLDERRPHD